MENYKRIRSSWHLHRNTTETSEHR